MGFKGGDPKPTRRRQDSSPTTRAIRSGGYRLSSMLFQMFIFWC